MWCATDYVEWMMENKLEYLFEADAIVNNLKGKFTVRGEELLMYISNFGFARVGTMVNWDYSEGKIVMCDRVVFCN